jgi:hypothetical protein
MSIVPRLIAAFAVAAFLGACFYVGYINEQLKAAVAPWHRAALMVGFILGAGAVSRHLLELAKKRSAHRNRVGR